MFETNFRKQFPCFDHYPELIYLDNAATTQKPQSVIQAITNFYVKQNANPHRGIYKLAEQATLAYEQARKQVANFIGAKNTHEVIFVRGTTEAINLVASSFGRQSIKPGDEIIISTMEHHSNLVPWQLLAKQQGANLKVIRLTQDGELDLTHYQSLLNNKVKLIAITHVSNVLGTINPVKKIISVAHQHNIPVLIDGAQAIAHLPVNVQDLDCDFYAFSGHKMYGPTGIGVLYGKEQLLEKMLPYQTGGGMINRVTFTETDFANLPQKFEAGTVNLEGAVSLATAIDFIQKFGITKIAAYESSLTQAALEALATISGLKILGNSKTRGGVISFMLNNLHPHDLATFLDHQNIAVRAGHHCAMPLMNFYGVSGTTRISFGVYNHLQEIDQLLLALENAKKYFAINN